MNNQIQLVLKSSTAEMSLNDHELGIYLTPELDGLVGLPEIRTTSGVNAGYDGGWTSAQNYDARSITIRGVIANTDVATVERLRKQLVSLAGQGKSEELTLDLVTEAGNAYTLQVRTIALEMSMQNVLEKQEFMLQLRADDPLIYDAGESAHEATLQVAKATGGFTIDFELPLAITGGSEESVVNNDGLEEVPTIVKMYGALHNPKIINQTNNEQMQIMTDLGYAEGAWHTPSEASEGTIISLANTPDSAPFSDIKLKGDTAQNGTPTPSAPVAVQTVTGENVVKICGKNLWGGFASDFSKTSQSVAYTNKADGSIFANGTASGNSLSFISSEAISNGRIITLQAGNYVISGGTSTVALQVVSSSGTEIAETDSYGVKAFTLSEATNIFVRARMARYAVADNVTIYPQLELSSTATAYQAYQGQDYEINLGKNLFDKDNYDSLNAYVNGSTITASDNNRLVWIPCDPDTAYAITVVGSSVSTGIYSAPNIPVVGGTANWLGSIAAGDTTGVFTTRPEAKYIVVRIWTNTASQTVQEALDALQIEKGSTPTSYAAYFTPIELCKIGTYQDYIWKDGDTWKVHKATHKIVLNGAESWSRWSTGQEDTYQTRAFALPTTFYGDNVPIYPQGSAITDLAKSNMVEVRGTAWGNSPSTIAINSTANLGLQYKLEKQYLNYTDSMTSDELVALFKTWLGSHITSLYYALATPADTTITNEALIEQLDNLLNLSRTYQGQTNMADLAASGNMPAILNVSYYTEKEPDTRDELIIDSRLHTVTLNGLDIYHLIGEGSEFLMLEPGENRLSLQSDITGDNGYAVVSYKQGYLSI